MKAIITYIQPMNQFGEKTYAGSGSYDLSLEFSETKTGADRHDTLTEFIEHLQCIQKNRKQSVFGGLESVVVRVPLEGVTCTAQRVREEF